MYLAGIAFDRLNRYRAPSLKCDYCGLVCAINEGAPPVWLQKQKARPKWALVKVVDGKRVDMCPKCKRARQLSQKGRT